MILLSFLVVFVNISSVFGDPCTELDLLLNLQAGSYSDGVKGHALFWETDRGHGPIFSRSITTDNDCQETYPLLISEAEEELRTRQCHLLLTSSPPPEETVILTSEVPDEPETMVGWVKPSGPVELEPFVTAADDSIELLVMGDTGHAGDLLRSTIRSAREKVGSIIHSAILLGG